MNLSEWLDNYRMIDFDRDHWCATGTDLERLWKFRGKQATAAEQARLLTVIAEIEGEFGPYPLREQKELIAQFRAAIKEATNGI